MRARFEVRSIIRHWITHWLDRPKVYSRYKCWSEKNPSKPFKQYFAETVERKLREGKRHESLGNKLYGDDYGVSGRAVLSYLVKLGLKPDDACVDYGCGTLRVGVHLIKYLNRGRYWGLDISEFLINEGQSLIGNELWEEKQPNLKVISDESVTQAAAAKASFLISTKVLIHVHPDELKEYLYDVVRIIKPSGQAIIDGKWSDTETLHYSRLSWAHSMHTLVALAREAGGDIEVIEAEDCTIDGIDQSARRGKFRIVKRVRF